MKTKKVYLLFSGVIVVMLLYVFGSMYIANRDQSGGSSISNTNGDGTTQDSGTNTNSPGNSGSSQQSSGGNQTANPTGAVQGNFVPGTAQQPLQPAPTQRINATQPHNTGSTGNSGTVNQNTIQGNQNNSSSNPLPQITINPLQDMHY